MKNIFKLSFILSLLMGLSYLQAHNLKQSVESEDRSFNNVQRDSYRHPFETLNFFGIKPEMTIVELSPGRGWYTEILATYMYDKGQLIAAAYDPSLGDYQRKSRERYESFLKGNSLYEKVEVVNLGSKLAEDGSVDAVLTFRNLHNWLGESHPSIDTIFSQTYASLKSGGIFGVVEHRAAPGTSLEEMEESGYVTEKLATSLAKKIGFELVSSSEINSNPKDTKDHPKGVWTLPPTYTLKDKDKEKYKAIGESDRMTLLFKKP